MEIKVKIEDCTKLAFDITDKSLAKRTKDEKLWLKLHGGESVFLDLKFEIERELKNQIKYRLPKKRDFYYYKPLKATDERVRELFEFLKGKSPYDIPKIIKIIREVDLYYEKKPYDQKYSENRKKILEVKKFLGIKYPIPLKNVEKTIEKLKERRNEWKKIDKQKIEEQKIEEERLKLIKKYNLDTNLNYEEVKKIQAQHTRKKLGIGEEGNLDLSRELLETMNKDLKKVEGFIYLRRWKVSGGTTWFKIGITNDLDRRESEQNVLPVAAQTLATAKLASMDHARAIEKSIQNVIYKYQIKNSNNRELFRLKPDDLASLIDLFRKIDLRNRRKTL